MALKLIGLPGTKSPAATQVRVIVCDLRGEPLFAENGSLFLAGSGRAALALARYWLRRNHTRVCVCDAKGERRRWFSGVAQEDE